MTAPELARAWVGGKDMYAVIRAGGKQYRVAPGDVVKIEKPEKAEGHIEFDVLAVSAGDGKIAKADGAKVVGEILGHGRDDKILVFHFKRKKQYKKLQGHRQEFAEVRISEISFGGKSVKAEPLPKKEPKAKKRPEAAEAEHKAKPAAHKAEAAHKPAAKKPAAKKAAAKKPAPKKHGKK